MEQSGITDDPSKIQETISGIITSTISQLTQAPGARVEGETRILVPDEINFISLTVTLNPSKLDAHAELIVSSKPIGKPSTTDRTEPLNQGTELADVNSTSHENERRAATLSQEEVGNHRSASMSIIPAPRRSLGTDAPEGTLAVATARARKAGGGSAWVAGKLRAATMAAEASAQAVELPV